MPYLKSIYTIHCLFVILAAFTHVVFMSELSQDLNNPATGNTVVFDDVISNVGHAYSSSTGVFRAPVDGNKCSL